MAIPVIYQLITMVILMVVGILLYKKNYLSMANAKGLSIVLTRVAVPCNMVVLLQREYSPEIFKGFLISCIATYLMCCIGAAMFFVVGKGMKMPPKELELLYFLAASPNHVFTREQLLDQIWGYEYIGDTRTVDVHIKRLREKIKDHDTWRIATIWGIGYKFEARI